MKIDRLIGILSVLLQREKVTAPYLAERFEVSRRTIARDIDTLCAAGIPIVTEQGKGGGISIMPGYKTGGVILTSNEMRAILAGLRGLDSVSGTDRYKQLMEKLSLDSSACLTSGDNMLIDLSSWYKSSLAPKIELLQYAVTVGKKVRFFYHSSGGEGERTVEPYLLIYRWSSWYLWGFCERRQDYRMFKLARMTELQCMDAIFEKRAAPLPDFSFSKQPHQAVRVRAAFSVTERWRLLEEFGSECITMLDDGRLLLDFEFSAEQSALSCLLSFGTRVELLGPPRLREKMASMAEEFFNLYAREKKTEG